MNEFALVFLLAIGGGVVGAMWTFVIGFGGAPGAMLAELVMRRRGTNTIPTWGLLLTLAGQLYASLVWVAFVVLMTRHHLANHSGIGVWLVWGVAFMVAGIPSWAALRDSASAEVRRVQESVTVFTAPLSTIGFVVFAFAPASVRLLWAWVPTV